jgi:hypothetical protein
MMLSERQKVFYEQYLKPLTREILIRFKKLNIDPTDKNINIVKDYIFHNLINEMENLLDENFREVVDEIN